MVEHTLEPIYNEKSQILILGTMPSIKSRQALFYYAHPQNRFFKVLEILFNEKIANNNHEKKQFLLKHHIALFDVLKKCEIDGSKDNSIKNIEINDFTEILENSSIKQVFTTGKKAYELYQTYCFPMTKIEAIGLPSTSSANIANYSLEDLVKKYKVILSYLEN